MTDPELRALALDIIEGRVYGTWLLRGEPQYTAMVFLPIALMSAEEFDRVRHYAHIYEYVSQAGEMAVNGKPTFFSFRGISHADWAKIEPMLVELAEARKAWISAQAQQ